MTEKELRKLNRYQLLELLIVQTARADNLQKQLDEAELKFADLGSIAEASLQLNGVFEAAQHAADGYIIAAKQKADEIIQNANEIAKSIINNAKTQAEKE